MAELAPPMKLAERCPDRLPTGTSYVRCTLAREHLGAHAYMGMWHRRLVYLNWFNPPQLLIPENAV